MTCCSVAPTLPHAQLVTVTLSFSLGNWSPFLANILFIGNVIYIYLNMCGGGRHASAYIHMCVGAPVCLCGGLGLMLCVFLDLSVY